jgi:zinc transport system ATP-binding protein
LSVVAARRLEVALGGHTVLKDIDFEVAPGEVVGLLGANGSGKSTLVRALLGLIPVESGSVELFGEPPGRSVPWGKVAYVPQDSPAGAGVPTSALDVVVSGLLTGARPWPPRGAKARALKELEDAGLGAEATRPLKRFSAGQRHRVMLARALVRSPALLIMDEPLAGVDAASAARLVTTLRARKDLTCLVVLHEPGPFDGYLTRAILLESGRLAADGDPRELAASGRQVHHHPDAPHRSNTPDLGLRP